MDSAPRIQGSETVNVFAGGRLDRAAAQRGDARWIAARLADPATRFVVHRGGGVLVAGDEPPAPVLLPPGDAAPLRAAAAETVFLGLDAGRARFALALPDDAPEAADAALARFGRIESLRAVGGRMTATDAALVAYGSGLLYWHSRHRFCGVCGAPTLPREAGHLRRCSDEACAADHFPRTDPAVIMLVSDGDRCLLGRQASWPEGLYSTLAGFVEPGESLEEAVMREVREEAGIAVRAVRYHSSQPWPFPGSLMLGFVAEAATTEIAIDGRELADARWFDRAALRNPDGFRLPSAFSIARRLIEDWIAGRTG